MSFDTHAALIALLWVVLIAAIVLIWLGGVWRLAGGDFPGSRWFVLSGLLVLVCIPLLVGLG